MTVGAVLLPLMAFADDDEKVQPMSVHDKTIQLWAWGGLAALILVPAIWYRLRCWQITHAGNSTDGMRNNQD